MKKLTEKIDSSKAWYAVTFGIAVALCGFIIYPLFDLFLCKVITKSEFIYSAAEHIYKPLCFGVFMGLVSLPLQKKKNSD